MTTTSRLRLPFKFSSDQTMDDPSDDLSDLDETEQESLISTLSTSNDSTNTLYTRIFTALPLLGTIPFLLTFLTSSSNDVGVVLLPCLLGMTSLVLSALVMGFVPLDTSGASSSSSGGGGGSGGSGMGAGRGTLSDIAHSQAARRQASSAGRGARLGLELPFCVPVDAQGPVARYAMMLNGVLSVGMVLFAVLLMGSARVVQGFWVLCLLPAVMAGVVVVVRGAMRDAETGLGELRGLRYGYKGA